MVRSNRCRAGDGIFTGNINRHVAGIFGIYIHDINTDTDCCLGGTGVGYCFGIHGRIDV